MFLHIQAKSCLPFELMWKKSWALSPFLVTSNVCRPFCSFGVIFLRLNTPRSFGHFSRSCSLHFSFCFFPWQCLRFLHVLWGRIYGAVCWLKSHLCETCSGTTTMSQDDIYPFCSNIGLLAWKYFLNQCVLFFCGMLELLFNFHLIPHLPPLPLVYCFVLIFTEIDLIAGYR